MSAVPGTNLHTMKTQVVQKHEVLDDTSEAGTSYRGHLMSAGGLYLAFWQN